MRRLEVLGWWFHERAPDALPLPQRLVAPWPAPERTAVLSYLRAGAPLVVYDAASHCRFACTDVDMGRRDLTDGTFVWPDGLWHYVERHLVRLPEHFVAHVLARDGRIAPFELPEVVDGLYDARPWLDWARAEGACLDLAGWQVPTDDDARRIDRELGTQEHDFVALCRADTRQVVLAFADATLEIRQLRPLGHAPRRLAGWHEWPMAR